MYSVDRQWCLGRSIPFYHFSRSIPFYCPKRVWIDQNNKRVWIDQDVIDGLLCMLNLCGNLCPSLYSEWDEEDIELALTLRSLNKRFYNILRAKKLLPLPSLSVLKKHFKHFKVIGAVHNYISPIQIPIQKSFTFSSRNM